MPRLPVTNRASLPAPNGFFVYAYLRTDTPKPYYVGVGTRRDRLTAPHAVKVPKDWSRIRILRQGLASKEEALQWEEFYVEKLGRKKDGGCLLNRQKGGIKGGDYDEDVIRRISAGIKARHAEGAFEKLNAPEVVKRRKFERMANKASEFGIPEDVYVKMPASQRDNAKGWLKQNPDKTFDDWIARGKTAQAAAKYGLTLEEWTALSRGQRNCLKEWMSRFPGRDPHDWLAGKRAKPGSFRPSVDRNVVFDLAQKGLSQVAIARELGCNASSISRILSGKRQSLTWA